MSLGSGLERGGEGEYTGSLDFKSRTMEAFKVEDIDVMGGKEKVDNVKQETSEIIILSVREGKVTNDPLREENTGKSETWGFVKCESGHLLGSENKAPNRREDLEKVEVGFDSGAGSRENGVVVWVKEETKPDLKREVVQPRPVVTESSRGPGKETSDDLVWCGELVWQESSSILPLVNSCPCTVKGSREVVGMLPTKLNMRLISMEAVQTIQTDLLRRSHRVELVPCLQGSAGQQLEVAMASMAGIVNQGDQLAILLLQSKAKGVIFGFVLQDRVDLSTLGSAATAKKQEAARYSNFLIHISILAIFTSLILLSQEEEHYPELC